LPDNIYTIEKAKKELLKSLKSEGIIKW
jgi:energy-coupling factor transport system ATP-binding protein